MKLLSKEIVTYASKCRRHASKLDAIAFSRLIRLLESDGRREVDSWDILKAVASSGLSKARQETNLVFQLLSSLKPVGLLEQLELKKALRIIKDSVRLKLRPIRSRSLVNRNEFRRALEQLITKQKGTTILALLAMLCAGRRFVDISRISAQSVKKIGPNAFKAALPFDKKHNNHVVFTIDFNLIPQNWSVWSASEASAAFSEIFLHCSTPFKQLSAASISKSVNFKVHGLRAIFAVAGLVAGRTEADVMKAAGWADFASLKRYVRLDCEAVKKMGSLDEAVDAINEELDFVDSIE